MPQAQADYQNSPTLWFTVLEAALRQQDFATAAKAKATLEKLGVKVTFVRLPETEAAK